MEGGEIMREHLSPTIVEIRCKTCAVTIRHNYAKVQRCDCRPESIAILPNKQFCYGEDAKFIKYFDLKLSPPTE